MCPNCGQELATGRLSEHCPECGARMAPGAEQCPICGAQRMPAGPRRPLGRWGRLAGAVALAAFVFAVLLIRPWERLTPEDLPSPNIALLPTATFTPTRRPTVERPPTVATRVTPTEEAAVALTIPPTRTPTPTPVTPTPTRPATYTVVEGDTPSEIAARFGVTTADLMEANGLRLSALLSIGQELIIPSPEGVGAGDEAATSTVEATAAGTPTATGTPAPTETPVPTDTPTLTPSATATHTPAPTATRRSASFTYTVEPGDTLSEIANANGLATAELAEANGLTVGAVLSVGQELVIPVPPEDHVGPEEGTQTPTPAPRIHVVRSGEHLGVIAALYDASMQEIAEANGITVSSILSIGQELIIPGAYAEPTAVAETPTATATPEATATPAPRATGTAATPAATANGTPGETPAATGTPGAPAQVIHVVAQGDTLGSIAVEYDVASERIATANGISTNSVLRIGQELIIPDTSLTPTPVPTPTATLSPTPTPTLSPTATATRVPGFIYARPHLLAPVGDATFRGREANVLVNWTSVGILPEDEWYVLRVWRAGGSDEPVTTWTKATSWRVPPSMHPVEGAMGDFQWQVNVMRRPLGAQTGVAISPSSEIYRFEWR